MPHLQCEQSVPSLLLIDDNQGDSLLTQIAFQRAGVAVDITLAESAETALELLKASQVVPRPRLPDLILLDLNLPRMNGFQFLDVVKSLEGLRCIPIVVLSSSTAVTDIERCYEKQVSGYLAKPVSMTRFTEAVKTLAKYWFDLVELPSFNGTRYIFLGEGNRNSGGVGSSF